MLDATAETCVASDSSPSNATAGSVVLGVATVQPGM